MAFPFLPIGILLATSFVIPIASLKNEDYATYIAAGGCALALIFLSVLAGSVVSQGSIVYQMENWAAPFGITLVIDSLSLFLSMLFALIFLLVITFSYRYIKERRTKYYSLLCLTLAGIMGILTTGDLFNMFVYMEVMSVASYALVAFQKDRPALEAGMKYLIIGSLGTSLILLGIAFLYGLTGTLNIADLASKMSQVHSPAAGMAMALLIAGFSIKAGLVPFHTWLPDAHPAAPSPVSAVLSGILIKTGIYAIARVGFVVMSSPAVLMDTLLVLGSVSMLLGSVLALVQTNLKRLLAYSSISQMGFIALSIGLGTPLGIAGGLLHIVNHALIKGLLFLCAAFVVYQAKTDNIYEISGNFKFHPVVSYSFLIGGLSLVGLPLFNGFISKWMIYIATLESYPFLTILALMATVLTLAYILKAFYVIFLGNTEPGVDDRKMPLSMMVPMVVLSALIIILGIMPGLSVWLSSLMASGLDRISYIGAVLK